MRPSRPLSRFGVDDRAVNEVVGFILMFAVSSVVLVISTQGFLAAKQNTDHMIQGVELGNVASRVASRVVHAGSVAEEFPNATFSSSLRIPATAHGEPYEVSVTGERVRASLQRASLAAESTTYNLVDVTNLRITGEATAERERFVIDYEHQWNATHAGPVTHRPAPVDQYKLITFSNEG